jgi:hypothetical protein
MGGLEGGRFVKPGEGVTVEKRSLSKTRNSLRDGSYNVADSGEQAKIKASLARTDGDRNGDIEALNIPNNKVFRNAYASLVLDSVWPPHSELVMGKEKGVFRIKFDENEKKSNLVRVSPEEIKRMPSRQMAEAIAESNQAVLIDLICGEFSDGKVPEISKDNEKNKEYFDAFKEQTDLEMRALGDLFIMIPHKFDSPSRFITAGLLVPRTIIFGLPNLIDDVSTRERVKLNSGQHRRAVSNSLDNVVPYFLPTIPLAIDLLNQLVAFRTGNLKLENWESRGNTDNYVVFPRQAMVQDANSEMSGIDLPVQTGCPVLASRVVMDAGKAKPFPRYLTGTVLEQLDALYYPKRTEEELKRSTDVFVASSILEDLELRDACQIM